MGKRLNVFVSDKSYAILGNYKKAHKFSNLDMALDDFITKHGKEKIPVETTPAVEEIKHGK